MIESQQLQHGRVQIVHVDLVLRHVEPQLVAFADASCRALMPPPAIHMVNALG